MLQDDPAWTGILWFLWHVNWAALAAMHALYMSPSKSERIKQLHLYMVLESFPYVDENSVKSWY